MKSIIKFVIFSFILFFTSCDFEWLATNKGLCFHVTNNSDIKVYTYASYLDVDSLLPDLKSNLRLISPKGTIIYHDDLFQDPDFKRMQNGEFITVFFFNKDTIDNNEWDYIRENNKYLKIYEYTKDSPSQIFYP